MSGLPATLAAEAEIIPVNYFVPLNLDFIYGNHAPLEVDLGCGDGRFLATAAALNPARNFLGIERMSGRVRSACRKIEAAGLINARILQIETSYAVRYLLPPGSVKVFHLMFPDPWPKRRHFRRRVVTEDWFAAIHNALEGDGTLRIATDQRDYFEEIEHVAAKSSGFRKNSEWGTPPFVSTFEARFRQNGSEIYRLVLRKLSPSRNGFASQ